jgi:hypothetical protein
MGIANFEVRIAVSIIAQAVCTARLRFAQTAQKNDAAPRPRVGGTVVRNLRSS